MEFNHPSIDPTSRLHPEADSLLNLLNHPDLLETQSLSDIRELFRRNGYREDPFHGGGVTIGWGRKVGDPHAATNATMMTRDGQVVSIGLGGKGLYSMTIFAADKENPRRESLQELSLHLTLFTGSLGKRFEEWWRFAQRKYDIPAITREEIFRKHPPTKEDAPQAPSENKIPKTRKSLRQKLTRVLMWMIGV